MAKPTKKQIASAALAIAIVGGGGVAYAGDTPEKDNTETNVSPVATTQQGPR